LEAARKAQESVNSAVSLLEHLSDFWRDYKLRGETLELLSTIAEGMWRSGELATIQDDLDGDLLKTLLPEQFKPQAPPDPEPQELDTDEKHAALKLLEDFWQDVEEEDRVQYTLNSHGIVLGFDTDTVSDAELAQRLSGDGEDARQIWFRVLAVCAAIQTGHRVNEARRFLNYFQSEGFFDRLYEARDSDGFRRIVEQGLEQYFEDRQGLHNEWTVYWRLLYDFEKARQLITRWDLIPLLHEVASEAPEEITGFLKYGKLPGAARDQKGLGQSVGKQAFFVVREMLRLGVWGQDAEQRAALEKAAYYPSRHTRRLVSQCGLLEDYDDPSRQLTLDGFYMFSHDLCSLVASSEVQDHFESYYDVPFLHYTITHCAHCKNGEGCRLSGCMRDRRGRDLTFEGLLSESFKKALL